MPTNALDNMPHFSVRPDPSTKPKLYGCRCKESEACQMSKVVNLALQGGGSHGAFTWGVLDRLLEEERLSFEGISATSAGAVNAVVLADGLAAGGREGSAGRIAGLLAKSVRLVGPAEVQAFLGRQKEFRFRTLNIRSAFGFSKYDPPRRLPECSLICSTTIRSRTC